MNILIIALLGFISYKLNEVIELYKIPSTLNDSLSTQNPAFSEKEIGDNFEGEKIESKIIRNDYEELEILEEKEIEEHLKSNKKMDSFEPSNKLKLLIENIDNSSRRREAHRKEALAMIEANIQVIKGVSIEKVQNDLWEKDKDYSSSFDKAKGFKRDYKNK